MKSFVYCIFIITIFMQPTTALAADYSDFDSHCKILWKNELKLLKDEVEQGELSEAEAEEEIADMSSMVEECVCYYQKVLEGGGGDIISYLQKADIIQMDYEYTDDEMRKLGALKFPEGLDVEALLMGSAKACGIETE